MTLTSGGPLPIPNTNVALSKHLVNGTKIVSADGVPIAIKTSEFSTSTEDEPGSIGGVVSGVNKGKAKFSNDSFDVFAEGKNIARLSDQMLMNGNQSNTTGPAETHGNSTGLGSLEHKLCKVFCHCDAGINGDNFVNYDVTNLA